MSETQPRRRSGRRPTWQVALALGVAAFVAALALAIFRVQTIDPAIDDRVDHIFTTNYNPPADNLQRVINFADGQAAAAFALDPTISHPERFDEGTKEFVYRAERPMFGWVVWVASFGHADFVPVALLLMTCLGVGLLAYTSVFLADQLGRVRRWGAITAVLPGSLLIVIILGPEPFAVALAVLGVYWWYGPPRRAALAVLMFVIAILMRDTLVLIPLTMALFDLVKRRRTIVGVLPLAIPPAVLAGWVVSLRVRWGHWPSEANQVERLAPPFTGWIKAIPEVEFVRTGSFVLGAILLFLALRRERGSVLTWIMVAFALSTVFYGENVLGTESYRPLLAFYVFGVILALPKERSFAARQRAEGSITTST